MIRRLMWRKLRKDQQRLILWVYLLWLPRILSFDHFLSCLFEHLPSHCFPLIVLLLLRMFSCQTNHYICYDRLLFCHEEEDIQWLTPSLPLFVHLWFFVVTTNKESNHALESQQKRPRITKLLDQKEKRKKDEETHQGSQTLLWIIFPVYSVCGSFECSHNYFSLWISFLPLELFCSEVDSLFFSFCSYTCSRCFSVKMLGRNMREKKTRNLFVLLEVCTSWDLRKGTHFPDFGRSSSWMICRNI